MTTPSPVAEQTGFAFFAAENARRAAAAAGWQQLPLGALDATPRASFGFLDELLELLAETRGRPALAQIVALEAGWAGEAHATVHERLAGAWRREWLPDTTLVVGHGLGG